MYISSYKPKEGERITYQRGTQDGHGGRAAEHHAEMRSIAEEVIREKVPLMAAEIYNEAISRMIGALEYDIKTIVEISFEDANSILTSEKTRRIVSDRILREIKAKLGDMKISI